MLLAEEFLLACLDDESGKKTLGGSSLNPALGAALLVDLVLQERIHITPHEAGWTKRGRVQVISTVPTDDPELDQVLRLVTEHEGLKLTQLVSDASGKRITKKLADRLLARLVAAGVLSEERSAVLGVRSWPTRDPGPEHEIRGRLHAALVNGTTPTEPTVALISLLEATGALPKVIKSIDPGADKRAVRQRAKQLSEGDWAAKAVKDAIGEVTAMLAVGVVVAASASSS